MDSSSHYSNVKLLIEKIKILDHSCHYDVFNILCKYNLNYSRNNNGYFFDFQNLDEHVIQELTLYISNIENNIGFIKTEQSMTPCSEYDNNIIPYQEDSQNESSSSSNDSKKKNSIKNQKKNTLTEECVNILLELNINNNVDLTPVLSIIQKDKTLTKKSTCNKFTLAKKKYSKPTVTDIKYTFNDLLVYDTT